MTRREAIFRGRVQGVGFRWTAHKIAQRFDVKGFVKNLANGNVQLVAEGSASELDAFLAVLQDLMSAHIRECTVVNQEPTGEFAAFEIVH